MEYENLFTSDDIALEELSKESDESSSEGGQPYIKFYSYDQDSNGKYKVTVRMLPGFNGGLPILEEVSHRGSKAGETPRAKSWCRRTMMGEPCICCYAIQETYNTLNKTNPILQKKIWSDIRSNFKKPTYYFFGVVIKDSKHPEKEGRIFKFRLDNDTFSIILRTIKGDVESDIDPDPIFSLKNGTNFVIDLDKIDGINQYSITLMKKPNALNLADVNKDDLQILTSIKESFLESRVSALEDFENFVIWAGYNEEYMEVLSPIINTFKHKYLKMTNPKTISNSEPEKQQEVVTSEPTPTNPKQNPKAKKTSSDKEAKSIDDILMDKPSS